MAMFGRGKDRKDAARQSERRQSSGAYGMRQEDLTVKDYAQGVPNIRLADATRSFMRQMPWVIILFLIGAVVIWNLTKDLKRTYTADGTIMVQLGDEHIYQPVGDQGGANSLQLTPDSIVLTEMGIIKNAEVIDRVIGRMMSDPAYATKFNEKAYRILKPEDGFPLGRVDTELKREALMKLRKTVDEAFYVEPSPKSSIINMTYKHEYPDIAVATLAAIMDEYETFRKEVFVYGVTDVVTKRRQDTETQLSDNELAIAAFLRKHNIADFASEQTGVQARAEELKNELNRTRASITESEAALMQVEDQLRVTSPTIDLYRDDRASQRIAQAELELGQLLAKYLPNSEPVRRKKDEINEMRAVQSSYNGQATGGRRVGPNPVHQTLTTRRNELQATANSLREKEFTLQQQLNSAERKVRSLAQLFPAYQNLLRERTTLAARLTTYNAKEQEALINQKQAEAASENVKVISRPTYATKGRNVRAIAFVVLCAFLAFMLIMIALARVFLDPRNFTSNAVRARRTRASDMNGGDRRRTPRQPHAAPPATSAYTPQEYTPEPYYGGGQNNNGQNGYPDYSGQGYGYPSFPPDYVPPQDPTHASYSTPQSDTTTYQPAYSNDAHEYNANPYAPIINRQGHLQTQNPNDMGVLGTVPYKNT